REQLGVATDCIQWSAQLVAHAGKELGFSLTGGERLFFGLLALFDVHAHAEPGADVARFIATGVTTGEEPAVPAVAAAQAELDLVIISGLNGRLPAFDDALAIVGMDHVDPPVAQRAALGKAGIVVPVRIAVSDSSVAIGEPDDLGRELEEILEPASGSDGPALE